MTRYRTEAIAINLEVA